MQYRLTLPEGADLDLEGGRQSFKNNILTITGEQVPEQTSPAICPRADDALLPSPYVQSDHTEIKKTALKVTDGAATPLEKTKQINDWIYKNLDKRPVLGLPDALTTLNSKQGDCNEHAVLFAALARSAGIPTRIAAGVTLNRGAFYYHAWNEVCLGSKWISVDSTTNQFPADLTHIRFILGEMQEQVRIGGLLGKLAIEPIPRP
jgi:transglutaminase-like putative cysteine protease